MLRSPNDIIDKFCVMHDLSHFIIFNFIPWACIAKCIYCRVPPIHKSGLFLRVSEQLSAVI